MTGSVAEFEEAFSELFVAARSLALRIVGSYSLAEDVAAETLIRAFVRWKRIGGRDWRKAWVLRVATNLSLKAVAKSTRSAAGFRPALASLEDTVVLREALGAALAALPRRQREVVVLRYLADVPEAEVAALLGTRSTTVRTHLRRGLASLRLSLGPSWEASARG